MAREPARVEVDSVDGAEVASVVAGCGVETPPESAVHGFGGTEAADPGHLFYRAERGLEETARSFEAGRLDMVGRGDPDLGLEHPAELTF
jgi:hypothetical protein